MHLQPKGNLYPVANESGPWHHPADSVSEMPPYGFWAVVIMR